MSSAPSTVDEIATLRAEIAALHDDVADLRHQRDAARAALDFRIRNMLAIVRSLFSRTVAAGGTLDEVADHFRGRFDVFARYQASAGRPGGGRDLEGMIWDELRNFEFDERISTTGPEARLPDDVALMVALAIHELVTNSIKFGALSVTGGGGRIAIDWTVAGDTLTIRWEETGVPVVAAAPVRRGFGREFIEHALPYQLDTETMFDLRPGGVLCTIAAPIGAAGPAGRAD